MSNEKIADVLGIAYMPETFIDETKQISQQVTVTGNDEKDDYYLSRSTLRSLAEVGANSLTELLAIAKTSQKARDYEVAATLIKTIADVTKDLKNLHKKETTNGKYTNTELLENTPDTNINVDKAIFVGTTAQLLSTIKKAMKTGEESQ